MTGPGLRYGVNGTRLLRLRGRVQDMSPSTIVEREGQIDM